VSAREGHRLTVATREAGELVATEPQRPLASDAVCVAIRPEKIRLARRGPATDAATAHALNRMEGVVIEANYLGGTTTYKMKLDGGAMVRAAVTNTARLDVDGYGIGQRVVAWFTADDCVVLDR
jgi:putrescine transport system ATP-binding protein